MPVAITIRDASKYFGTRAAVNGFSLDVPAGNIYGFLGRNGAGKATTRRMITRILQPDTCSVSVLGDCKPTACRWTRSSRPCATPAAT